jgi:hypothetical protein
MSSNGEIRYSIQIDDSNVNQKLSQFKSSLQQVSFVTQNTARPIQTLSGTLLQMERPLTQVQRTTVQTGRSVASMGNQFSSTLNPIKNSGNALNTFNRSSQTTGSSFRKLGGIIAEGGTSFGILGSSVIGLVSQFNNLRKAQVATEAASLKLSKAQNKVEDMQRALNKMVAAGKQGTVDYTAKLADMKLTQEQIPILQERALIKQEDLNLSMSSFASDILPNVISTSGSLIQTIDIMRNNWSNLKGIIPGLVSGLGGLATSFTTAGTAAGAAATNVNLFKAALIGLGGPLAAVAGAGIVAFQAFQINKDIIGELTDKMNIQIQNMPVWEAAWIRIRQTFGLASKEEIARLDALELLDKKTQELQNKIQKDIPLSSRIFGLTPADKQKILNDIKGLGTDVQNAIKDILQEPVSMNSGPIVTINTQLKQGAQVWFPEYILKLKSFRDTIQSLPPVEKSFKMDPTTIQFFQYLNNPNPTARTSKNIDLVSDSVQRMNDVIAKTGSPIQQMMGNLKDPAAGKSFLQSFENDLAQFPDIIQKIMDDALGKTQSGLDRIIGAWHEVHGKGTLGFEKEFDKSVTTLDKFLAKVGKKLDKGGSDSAKEFVESYTTEADKKMEGAARIQFQPIFDYVEQHKGEDAGTWMEGFLQLLDGMEDDTKKKFTQLLIKDKKWKSFGEDSGQSWTKGFTQSLDDAKREANKAAEDIADALHLPKGSFKFDVKAKGGLIDSKALGGIVGTAAIGRMFTTRGPTLTLAGDNPGGKETVAYIPHNDPGPTVQKLYRKFGAMSEGHCRGDAPITLNLTYSVDGNEIIDPQKLHKTIMMKNGKNMTRFGPT